MLATETLAKQTAKVQKRKSVMMRAVEEFKAAQQEASEGRGRNSILMVLSKRLWKRQHTLLVNEGIRICSSVFTICRSVAYGRHC